MCEICWEDKDFEKEAYHLNCDHYFCKTCFVDAASEAVK